MVMENRDGEKNGRESGWEKVVRGEGEKVLPDIIKEGTASAVVEYESATGERGSLLFGLRFFDGAFIDRMALLIAEITESCPTAELDNQVLRTVSRKGGARGHFLLSTSL